MYCYGSTPYSAFKFREVLLEMWQLTWALKTSGKLSYTAERRKVIYGREESMEREWRLGKTERKHDALGEMWTILCDWHCERLEMEETKK